MGNLYKPISIQINTFQKKKEHMYCQNEKTHYKRSVSFKKSSISILKRQVSNLYTSFSIKISTLKKT